MSEAFVPLYDVETLRKLHHEHRDPDPAHIAKLPKPTKRDNPKGKCKECGGWHGLPAVHLDYMGHAEVTDVLLEADPTWTWEPYAIDDRGLPLVTEMGADRVLWIRLTIGGVTRPGVGTAAANKGGDALKELIGDAIRNAAMRFGIALTLWSKADGVEREVDQVPPQEQPKKPAGSVTKVEAMGIVLEHLTAKAGERLGDAIKEHARQVWAQAEVSVTDDKWVARSELDVLRSVADQYLDDLAAMEPKQETLA
jgi:hypothetical protein